MLIDDIVNESGAFFYDCINDAIPFITDPAPSVTGKGSRPPLLEESNTCPLDCSFPCITVIYTSHIIIVRSYIEHGVYGGLVHTV